MDRKTLLKEMKDSIGTQEPIVFFGKMVDMFNLLFDRIDVLENEAKKASFEARKASLKSALAIQWEPKLASSMLTSMIKDLQRDKDTFHSEITQLKQAFVEDRITQSYDDFVKFWQEVLGYHPFLDYDK